MKYEDHNFDQSNYERPNTKFVCGRKRLWKKSCWQGAGQNGKCGGASECTPKLNGDRYECTRPERAGGLCSTGPMPDGSCCRQHPPCKPGKSLRSWRKRFSYLVALFVFSSLIAFTFNSSPVTDANKGLEGSLLDPGPLTRKHASFGNELMCANCHEGHDQGLVSWVGAAFKPQSMTNSCASCHVFDGEASAAHQGRFSQENDVVPTVDCVICHAEHNGKNASLVDVSNQTCSNCHENEFVNLADHTAFSETYPYDSKQTIYFDHRSHIKGHFTNSENKGKRSFDDAFADKASTTCTACHDSNNATRDVKPLAYEQMCSSCHNQQITKNHLVVMTIDEASPVLLGLLDGDDADSEEEAIKLIESMSEDAMQPLVDLTGMQSSRLWRGFNAFEAKGAAEQWLEEESHEAVQESSDETDAMSGWFFGENSDGDESISYKPVGHKDPVVKAWIDLYLLRAKQDTDNEKVTAALEMLLDSKGPGACAKCHGAGLVANDSWGYQDRSSDDGVLFKHKPHINLIGKTESCETCHELDTSVDLAEYFESNGEQLSEYQRAFTGIKKETCTECHSEQKIKSDCTVCHQYHGPSSFGEGFLSEFKYTKQSTDTTKVKHDN